MIDAPVDGELSCIGYAEFCIKSDTDPSFAQWFIPLSKDIDQLAGDGQWHRRLVALQNSLVDLINLLDPESVRFPDRHRGKLQAGAAA
jgi:hypothetical protein